MPDTAADLDVQDSFDPRDNIDGGVRHLKRLMARFHNNVPLALAAYNAGEQAVISHRGIPPYRETRQYVVRVLRRYDREAARLVAQQLAAPKSSTPKIVRVSYAGGRAVTAPVIPVLADAEGALRASPDGQFFARPFGNGGTRLKRGVGYVRDVIGCIEAMRGTGEGGVHGTLLLAMAVIRFGIGILF